MRSLIVAAEAAAARWPPRRAGAAVVAVKAVHTLAWLGIEASMAYALYAGLRGRSDRRAAAAGAVVAGEALIYVRNGWCCPLTELAEAFGARSGSVTNMYLPLPVARNLPAIHAPLIVTALLVHARNLGTARPYQRSRRTTSSNSRRRGRAMGESGRSAG